MLDLPFPFPIPCCLLGFSLPTKMGAPRGPRWAPVLASSEEPQGQRSEWLTSPEVALGAFHLCQWIRPHNDPYRWLALMHQAQNGDLKHTEVKQ